MLLTLEVEFIASYFRGIFGVECCCWRYGLVFALCGRLVEEMTCFAALPRSVRVAALFRVTSLLPLTPHYSYSSYGRVPLSVPTIIFDESMGYMML